MFQRRENSYKQHQSALFHFVKILSAFILPYLLSSKYFLLVKHYFFCISHLILYLLLCVGEKYCIEETPV